MKIIVFYLPQFHTIPENDEWWGKNFTEWTNVKASKPLFKGHRQPKVPLNNNYYCLLDDDIKIWQANLAKQYGIYGFCYYHYWYNGHMLLEKPMEQMLVNKKINIPFCISWCNQPWSKSWIGDGKKVLIAQSYGDENEWVEHYKYLSKFFKDDRYIFKDGKPLLNIYKPNDIPQINDIVKKWNELAINDGFKGICFSGILVSNEDYSPLYDCLDYVIDIQPANVMNSLNDSPSVFNFIKNIVKKLEYKYESLNNNESLLLKLYRKFKPQYGMRGNKELIVFPDYESLWKKLINLKPNTKKSIPCAFCDWDNTPRYKEHGSYIPNVSIDVFKKYFKQHIINVKNVFNQDMMFFVAWNEWCEGSILEPTIENRYGFLEAIKCALEDTNEFPW